MNNPPAFPYSFPDGKHDNYSVAYGMTLRDYFAAKAIPQCFEVSTTTDIAAKEAYRMADAMLKAREE
jgi:hypothetical protein